jgi:hypothetical protein
VGRTILNTGGNLQKIPVDSLHLLEQITGSLPHHTIPIAGGHINHASTDEYNDSLSQTL